MPDPVAKRGRGRPRNNPPTKRVVVYMTDEQVRLLRMWGRGDMSAGLRWLINTAAALVRRADVGRGNRDE